MLKLLSINNEFFQGDSNLEKFMSSDVFNCLRSNGHYPYSDAHTLLIDQSLTHNIEVEGTSDLVKTLSMDPVGYLRLISEYCSDAAQDLNLGLEILAVFGLNLRSIVLSQQKVPYTEFFAGRVTALINFYDILVRGFLASEFTKLQGLETDKALVLTYLSNMPNYLMALYKPGIFANLALRTNDGHENFIFHLKQQSNHSLSELITIVMHDVSVPAVYEELAQFINNPPWARKRWGSLDADEAKIICQSHSIANIISAEIFQRSGVQGLQSVIRSLKRLSGIPLSKIEDLVSKIPEFIATVSEVHQLPKIPLPEYVYWYGNYKIQSKIRNNQEEFYKLFLLQIKISLDELSKEQPYALHEAIWATLESLLYCLGFQRACYFVFNHTKQALVLETTIGVKLFDYEKTEYKLAGDSNSETILEIINNKRTDSNAIIFNDGWPFFAFPVLHKGVLSGMFYADRAKRPDSHDFDSFENNRNEVLARLWKI